MGVLYHNGDGWGRETIKVKGTDLESVNYRTGKGYRLVAQIRGQLVPHVSPYHRPVFSSECFGRAALGTDGTGFWRPRVETRGFSS
jgi:hypothetical protein